MALPLNNIPLRAKGYLESGIGLITTLTLTRTLTLTPTVTLTRTLILTRTNFPNMGKEIVNVCLGVFLLGFILYWTLCASWT